MTAENLSQSARICTVADCNSPLKARGYCGHHYSNWYRRGNPLIEGKRQCVPNYSRRDTLADRFWSYVTPGPVNECWEWKGTKTIYGYGQMSLNGKLYRAHRVSFFIANGYWPEEVVMHDCDNKICVNPHHLDAGTFLENTKQAAARGLYAIGEKQGASKLTDNQVSVIKRRLEAGEPIKDVAAEYTVSTTCIARIKSGAHWRHIQ